jgi:hypothetical protein
LIPVIVLTILSDAAHAVAYEVTVARDHIRNAVNARAVIADTLLSLGACAYIGGNYIWLPSLAEAERALGAVVVRVAPVFDLDKVTGPVAPEVLAIPLNLGCDFAERLERQTTHPALARRLPAVRIARLLAVGC